MIAVIVITMVVTSVINIFIDWRTYCYNKDLRKMIKARDKEITKLKDKLYKR